MKHKGLFWLLFTMIVALSWVDYQYFIEGTAYIYTPLQRQAAHITILIAILPIGYFAWRQHPATWLRQLWLAAYIIAISFIGLIGIVQWKTAFFSTTFLDNISSFRLFFCSPLPFLMLYVLHNVLKDRTLNKTSS